MLSSLRVVRASAERIAEASRGIGDEAGAVAAAIRDGRIEQEPAITDRLLGRIEAHMDGFETNGMRWSAKTLTDRGRGAQESRYGADFIGVLEVNVPSFRVRKGFLAQAKLVEPSESFSSGEWDRLSGQCRRMLALSPASYVFLYSIAGVTVVPALSVVSVDRTNPHKLYQRSIVGFFLSHFESFIGDVNIAGPHVTTLEKLAAAAEARQALLLQLNRA
jgi:hypothetical protein